jgi:soluble lytic murein transglycosylase-like protein
MRYIALGCVWLLMACAPARLEPDLVERYAAAVRWFNSSLGPAGARLLAGRVLAAADCEGLDARLVVALVAVESSWDPGAVSRAGARGLGQLMPATALGLGVDPDDPEANVRGTAHHLARLVRSYAAYGSPDKFALALGAYNAGSGAVARFGGIPPYAETQAYVRRVLRLWRRLAGVGGSG